MTSEHLPQRKPSAQGAFVTTRWTEVLAAGGNSEEAKQALSDLCSTYYAPVVAFLRNDGRTEEMARELAHEFFTQVLERQSLGGANPARGRFRSYLLGALKHFLTNRRIRESREKRGGRFVHEPLHSDTDTPDGTVASASTPPPPDSLFDREWALSLLDRAFQLLGQESEEHGARPAFELLKPWLTGESLEKTPVAAAQELGTTEGAVRVAIHRLRRRFREIVKAEIAQTVERPGDIADELRHLIAALN